MSEQRPATSAEGSLGERRRRRLEAEAARAAGASEPLSRKEIRRRRLEEEARLAAIATGELPMMEAASPPGSGGAAAEHSPEAAPEPAEQKLSRRELRELRRRELGTSSEDGPEDVTSTERSETGPAAQSPAAPTPAAPTPPPQRAAGLRDRATERPAEITSTGRRPVVRAPHTASAIRSLDETGALSGIQPVVREEEDPQEYAPEASSNPAEWSGTFTPVSAEIPLTASTSAPPASEPEARPAPAAAPPQRAATPSGPAQPSWRSVTAASPAASAETVPPGQAPNRRSMRDRMDVPAEERSAPLPVADGSTATRGPGTDDPSRSTADPEAGPVNPVVRMVRVLALVLAAILIGVLITLLWLDQRSDSDDSPDAAPDVTEIALPLPPLST
ncbi:hypothetical protein [Bogoriella caseilytica]|uniref:Meckel syndrome type 1 protein n=1 Tax=Bogoriella caseilytica TaxID=56055 RepID=A0A3N2B9D5_9MICO|nr:hypothetical protein [Bogoriella caseilytica]ROR71883.1 hypothetical protein EDD31_0222 [Bogoriella caseilytica]